MGYSSVAHRVGSKSFMDNLERALPVYQGRRDWALLTGARRYEAAALLKSRGLRFGLLPLSSGEWALLVKPAAVR